MATLLNNRTNTTNTTARAARHAGQTRRTGRLSALWAALTVSEVGMTVPYRNAPRDN